VEEKEPLLGSSQREEAELEDLVGGKDPVLVEVQADSDVPLGRSESGVND
jgi:hypothetical protein